MPGEYIVAQCRYCGNIQGLQVTDYEKAIFKCYNCPKTSKIHDSQKGGFTVKCWGVGQRWNCRKSAEECAKIKKRQGEGTL